MSGLDELRQRVEAAEGHFGMIAAQSETYSTRLTGLMSRMEQAHADQQSEIAALTDKAARADAENRELRGMLLGLLQAIETGDGSGVGNVVRDLEHRIDSMVGGMPEADETAAADSAAPALDSTDDAPAEEPAASAPAMDDVDDALEAGLDVADSDSGDTDLADVATGDETGAPELEMESNDAGAAAGADAGAPGDELSDADMAALLGDDEASADAAAEEHAGVAASADAGSDDVAAVEMTDVADGEATPDKESGQEDIATEAVSEDAPDEADATAAPQADAPIPETVALDDTVPEDGPTSGPANELLSRVDAVANALMAGGFDLESGDEELTGEISALLQDAIGAKRAIEADAAAAGDAADMAVVEGEGDDISVEDWPAEAMAEADEDEIVFESDAA